MFQFNADEVKKISFVWQPLKTLVGWQQSSTTGDLMLEFAGKSVFIPYVTLERLGWVEDCQNRRVNLLGV